MLLPLLIACLFAYSTASNAALKVEYPDDALNLLQLGNNADKADTPCISPAFQACQVQFNKYLGIQDTLDWHSARDFYQEINARVYNNTGTFLQVCGAYTQLYQCLGTSYRSCINPRNFIEQGLPVTDAFQYVQAIHSLQFKCAGGLEQGIMKWDKIINVYKTQQQAMEACFRTFTNSINNDFTHYCDAVYTLENCFSSLFVPLGSEVAWWACEDIRVGFSYYICPDEGKLVCRIMRRRDESNAQANSAGTVDEFGEQDKYNNIKIGMSKVYLEYPPKEQNDQTFA